MEPLDNVFWKTMVGAHAQFAVGAGGARRFAPGFSPMLGFEDTTKPDFAALAAFCQPGERFYVDDWSGEAPPGWSVVLEKRMKRMVWQGAAPDEEQAPEAVPLGPEHAQQAVDLAMLTNPGPFGLRTIELGDFFGVFEQGRLVAMAGERLYSGSFRELSGVCTHPDHQGRGLARRLSARVVAMQMRRGQTSFLHVISQNTGALHLYQRMGFREYRETVMRVVERGG